LAADKVANTVGQYDAFLKNLARKNFRKGKHLVDESALKRLSLKPLVTIKKADNRAHNQDANELIRSTACDVLYLDPPYNNRQYGDCYHVLENIASWQKPKVYGVTKKFDRTHLKSRFSSRSKAAGAFELLIRDARASHIFLSYNNEGIIPDDAILRVLSMRGDTEIIEIEYAVFGNGAGRSRKRKVKERIFYCKVTR
jgi:adenine-specific DNA-methyltransferase